MEIDNASRGSLPQSLPISECTNNRDHSQAHFAPLRQPRDRPDCQNPLFSFPEISNSNSLRGLFTGFRAPARFRHQMMVT